MSQGGYHGQSGGNLDKLKKEVSQTTPADIQAENAGTQQADQNFQESVASSYRTQGTFDPTNVEQTAAINDSTETGATTSPVEPSTITPPAIPGISGQDLLNSGNAVFPGMAQPSDYTQHPVTIDQKIVDYKAQLGLRRMLANYFPTTMWEANPQLASHLLMSGMPNQDVKRLGMAVVPYQKWAADTNSIGGISNALTSVYLNAIRMPDPYQRKMTIQWLNSIKNNLSSDQQTQFLAALSHPEVYFSGTSSQATQDAVGQVIPGAKIVGGQIILPSEGRATTDTSGVTHPWQPITVDQIMSLEQTFPALKGKVYFDSSGNITPQDWQQSLYNAGQNINPFTIPQRSFNMSYSHYDHNGNKIAGSTLEQIVTEQQKRGFFASVGDYAWTTGTEALKTGFAGPAAAVFMNLPELGAGLSVGLDSLPFGIGKNLRNSGAGTLLSQGAHIADLAFQKVSGSLGDAGNHVIGIKDSTLLPDGTWADPAKHQAYMDSRDKIGNLMLVAIMSGIGEYRGAAKVAGEGLPDAMAAQMGLGDYNPETGRVGIWDSIVKQFGDTTGPSKFLHPLDIVGQALRAMGANHRFVGPETFWSSGIGDRFLNEQQRIIQESGGDASLAYTDIQRHSPYPLDPGFVKALIATGGDLEGMRTAAIDFMKGEYKPPTVDGLNTRIDTLNQAHGKLTQVVDDWQQKVYEPQTSGMGVQIPGQPPVPDGFTRIYRGESGQGAPTFWTESLNVARQFARGDMFGQLGKLDHPVNYIDIPTDSLDAHAPEGDPQLAERLVTDPNILKQAKTLEGPQAPPIGSLANITGDITDGVQPPLQGPNGNTVSLEGGRIDKSGTRIGDISPGQVEWIRLSDLRNLHNTSDYDVILPRNLDTAEQGKVYTPEETAAYRAAIADGHFPKPVEIFSDPVTGRIHVNDGNHIVQAATEAGSEYIPVIHLNPVIAPEGVSWQASLRMLEPYAPRPLTDTFPNIFHAADSPLITDVPMTLKVDRLAAELRTAVANNGTLSPEAVILRQQLRVAQADYTSYIGAQGLLDKVAEAKAHIDQQVADIPMGNKPIEFRYPGKGGLSGSFHKIWDRPTTDGQRFWREVLNPGAKVKEWLNNGYESLDLNTRAEPWMQRLTDKIAQTPKIYNMLEKDAPKNGHDLNAQVVTRIGNRFGWDESTISRAITDFREAKTSQDFYDASSRFADTIDANLPANTPQRLRDQLTSFWNRTPQDFKMSHPVYDATGKIVDYEPLLPDANGNSIPSISSEFINHLKLPNISLIDEVMSTTRRWTAQMKSDVLSPEKIDSRATRMMEDGTAEKYGLQTIAEVKQRLYDTNGGGRLGKSAAYGYDIARGMLVWSKMLLMPASLLFHIPGIIFKKTIDEGLGNRQYFDVHGNLRPSNEMAAELTTPTPETIGGSVGSGLLDYGNGDRIIQNVRTSDLIDPAAPNNSHFWNSKISMLDFMRKDPMVRKFIDTGFDPSQLKNWLDSNPDYKAQLDRQLGTGNMTVDGYLTRLETSIRMETFNDSALQRYITDGRMIKPSKGISSADANKYDSLKSDAAAINKRLDASDNSIAAIRSLMNELANAKRQMRDLEDRFPNITEDAGNLHQGSPKAMAKYLAERMANGGVDGFNPKFVPETVRIDRWASDAQGAVESFREAGIKFSQAMYSWFKPIGKVEAGWARGNFYKQAAAKYYRAYSKMEGMDSETAQAFAEARAISETKDVFYGIDSRSTMERQMRNVFWYAPLTGEMIYRWLYAIPESRGLVTGLITNAGTASAMFHLMQDYHIIHQDTKGAWVLPIPGLQRLVDTMAPHLNVDIKLGTITHIAPTMPQVSVVPGFALALAQKHIHSELLNNIVSMVDPMGASTEFVPTALKNILSLMGMKVPDVNPESDQLKYDVLHDQALQYSYTNMVKSGDTQPLRKNYANDDAYTAAWTVWFGRLNNQANDFAKGMTFASILQGTVMPGTLSMSSTERDDFTKFWKGTILPQLSPNQPMPSAVKDELNKWLANHPASLAFSISYNFYTGKQWQSPPSVLGDKYYQDLYLYGLKGTMDPTKYAYYLAAITAKQSFDAYRNSAIQDIAGTGPVKQQASNLLTHWGDRRLAMQQYQDSWDLYLKLHPDAAHIVNDVTRGIGQFKGYVSESTNQQYISQTLLGLSQLSGLFTGTNDRPTSEYKTVVGQLRAAEVKSFKATGGTDPLSNQLNSYFNSIISPYMDQVQPLYDLANRARNAQQDAAPYFTKIVAIENHYTDLAVKAGLPSPEAFFYGTKDKQEQEWTKIGWMTKPISWLTDFQREQVGYTDFKGSQQMWKEINDAQQALYSRINDPNNPISTASNLAKSLKSAEAQTEVNIAKKYGQAGIRAMALNNETPAQRIQTYIPQVAKNKSWQTVMGALQRVNEAYKASGLTVGGNSSYGLQLKEWLYNGLQWYESNDPQFRSIMNDMSNSMPGVVPGQPRLGVPLYEALFFGNFSNKYLPPALTNSVHLGKKGI